DIDGPEVELTRGFLAQMFADFANHEFKHYQIPREGFKVTKNKVSKTLPMNIKNFKTMKLSSKNTEKKATEMKGLELINVMYVASVDWSTTLSKKVDGLFKRDWKFKEYLSDQTIARLEDDFPA